jgi:hypothetical protein
MKFLMIALTSLGLSAQAFAAMPAQPQPAFPIALTGAAEEIVSGQLVKTELFLGAKVSDFQLKTATGVLDIVFDQSQLSKCEALIGRNVMIQGVKAVALIGVAPGQVPVFYGYFIEANGDLKF